MKHILIQFIKAGQPIGL